jgi:branched-chain amino acid transport system ATP-binding protein
MSVDALKLDNVKKNFAGTEIIRGLNLSVAKDERHAVIGPNGAGKSTAYNLITGRYQVSSGKVFLNGEDITNLQPYEVKRKGLSRSFQITNIFPKMSVFENVRCSLLWAMGYKYSFWQMVGSQSKLNNDAEEIIEELNLKDRRDTLAGVLSYAEQRALEIGITIAGGSEVILLDEPTAGMSVSETEYIVELIRKVTEGKTLVVVEHDMGVVFDLADRISVLVYGEIIATGTPTEVKENQAVQEAYLGAAMEEH